MIFLLTVSDIREMLEDAYLAGFAASGEGWNGEYPFDDLGLNPQDDPDWVEARDRFLAEIGPPVEEQSS